MDKPTQTEVDWLASNDPVEMLRYTVGPWQLDWPLNRPAKASDRKLRLFVEELEIQWHEWRVPGRNPQFIGQADWFFRDRSPAEAATEALRVHNLKEDLPREAAILRDIFGNCFNHVTADPAWQSATVVSLATAIYEERAFDRMWLLADALEDSGCEDRRILDHCRLCPHHVRGCWVIDIILGKE